MVIFSICERIIGSSVSSSQILRLLAVVIVTREINVEIIKDDYVVKRLSSNKII